MVRIQFPASRVKPRRFSPPRGEKEIWLPNFTITLLRTTYLPASMACFQVPLNMNKLDIKDYLWNAYRIPVLAVRSYIQHQKVRGGKAGDILERPRYWTRPKSTKRMIVELGEGEHGGPFVWPEPIQDFEPFDNDAWKQLKKLQEGGQTKTPGDLSSKAGKGELSRQVKALLSGTEKWTPSKPMYARE